MHNGLKVILAFLAAIAVTTVLGSIFQTQLNLIALRDIAPPVGFSMRVDNTLHDLINFAPLYLLIVSCALFIAFAIAELIARRFPNYRFWLLVLAAIVGLWVTFHLINMLAPMPTFIAATRTLGGTAVMLLAAAIGAAVYALITSKPDPDSNGVTP
ncbi:hypothetical protein CWE09_13480 [Aliidiomarina minuta]|uniref:Uncharacterized protein n=1 Tax=Aliidiomarina minuta TaxID=880057 RepID=A0A432W136_9GAMM|nr:hypothetical protein [Aliidiomarina minuta]RUO22940.1 hypothetical protein CWE09_13480 [Aliidiomarina minuta]